MKLFTVLILFCFSLLVSYASITKPTPITNCSCELNEVCNGPNGGKYCFTKTGTKRYLVDISKFNCPCTYPLKSNTNWCTGSKGGQFCINKKGGKSYRPKTKI